MDILNNIVLILQRYWDLFLEGIGVTLLLSAIAVGCGVIIGSLLALMRLSKWHIGKVRPLNLIATIYVEIIRGTPLLLQLYFFFFLLPMMIPALETSASFSITLALCLNSRRLCRRGHPRRHQRGRQGPDRGRAFLRAERPPDHDQGCVPAGDQEHPAGLMQRVCHRSSRRPRLASTFFVGDLMTTYRTINGVTYLSIEPLIIVGIIYFVLTFTLSKAIAVLERRLKTSD